MSKVIDITTYQQGEEMAESLGNKLEAIQNQDNELMKNLLSAAEGLGPDDLGELAAVLALPDDQFKVIAPLFKDAIFRTLNDNNSRLLMIKGLNASGMTLEDFHDQTMEIVNGLDAELTELGQDKVDFIKEIFLQTYNIVAESNGLERRIVEVPMVLGPNAKEPNYAHIEDAGADLFAVADYDIAPGETVIVDTALYVAIPHGYYGEVKMKSGIAAKTKLRLANGTGTIDCGYTGPIGIIFDNIGTQTESITKGQKIAQLLLIPVAKMGFVEVKSLTETARGEGGYGSTGI